jgi:hypothetical protein
MMAGTLRRMRELWEVAMHNIRQMWMRTMGTKKAWKRRVAILLAIGLLTFILTACNDSTSATTPQPTTPIAGATTGADGGDTGTPIPTVKPAPSPTGPGAQSGVADICSQPASVTVQPPSNIPTYAGARLHISQVDPSNSGNVFYGFCSGAAVQDIYSFYQQQLPGKGWSNLTTYEVAAVRQVRATQGQTQITVSISPSAVVSGTANISITVIGG